MCGWRPRLKGDVDYVMGYPQLHPRAVQRRVLPLKGLLIAVEAQKQATFDAGTGQCAAYLCWYSD